MKKIVIYINQFFGQIGGEEMADCEPSINEKPVGPAAALQNMLKGGQITHTIICGDNYMASHTDDALDKIGKLLEGVEFDLFMAGPAFLAGRYGSNCGAVCKYIKERFNVPVFTSMNSENPGVEMYRRDFYILKGGNSAAAMRKDLPKMAEFANKMIAGEPILWADAEGYFPRGIRQEVILPQDQTADKRAVDMLLKKLHGEPFETELPIEPIDFVPIAAPLKEPGKARIAFVSTGGIVPEGNPDRIATASASNFGRYDISGLDELKQGEWESVHGGYDRTYANANPMTHFPLDAFRRMEKEGKIGSLDKYFYTTVGNLNSRTNALRMAHEITEFLREDKVDAVIFGSA